MADFKTEYVLQGRPSKTPASFFKHTPSLKTKGASRGLAEQDASFTDGLKSRQSSQNKTTSTELRRSRLPTTSGPITPNFVYENPTFGKSYYGGSAGMDTGRRLSPLVQPRVSSLDEDHGRLSPRGQSTAQQMSFGKNPLRFDAFNTASPSKMTGHLASTALGTTTGGSNFMNTQAYGSLAPSVRFLTASEREKGLEKIGLQTPSFANVSAMGTERITSDVDELSRVVNEAFNYRALLCTIPTLVLDYLVYYLLCGHNFLVFAVVFGWRFFNTYFVLNEQIKYAGMVPFDFLSFMKFRYFDESQKILLSVIQLVSFFVLAKTFEGLFTVGQVYSPFQSDLMDSFLIILALVQHYLLCTDHQLNKFRYTVTLRSLLPDLGKYFLRSLPKFGKTLAFKLGSSWIVALLIRQIRSMAVQDPESVESLVSIAQDGTGIFGVFEPQFLVVVLGIDLLVWAMSELGSAALWLACSLPLKSLLETQSLREPALVFSLCSEQPGARDCPLRCSTAVDSVALSTLERYPKVLSEITEGLDERASRPADRAAGELLCKYTADNMDKLIKLVSPSPRSDTTEQESDARSSKANKFGVDSWDRFESHAKMTSNERQFAVTVANRGDLMLLNLRLVRIFTDRIRASVKSETLKSTPIVQEMLSRIKDADMALQDFHRTVLSNDLSARKFSYGASMLPRVRQFVRAFHLQATGVLDGPSFGSAPSR